MIGRRAVIGLSLLSALVFFAFAAPSAFATKGTTSFTCVKTDGVGDWKDPHCTEADATKKSNYSHAVIKGETEVTVSNKNTKNSTTEHTPAILKTVLFGASSTVTCTNVHGTGKQTNNAGPPMTVTGTVSLVFSECSAKVGLKETCSVVGNEIKSNANGETQAEAMEVKFTEDGAPFAKFEVSCPVLGKVAVTVTGSATGIPKGATLEFTKASTEAASCPPTAGLCANGQKASFETVITTTMSTAEPGISLTTTEE